MNRRRVAAAVAGVAVGCLLLAAAYLTGWWQPHACQATLYPVRGIDVSNHQGIIDWDDVADDGMQFAYIKATEGGDWRDAYFPANWELSAEAGVCRGAYHFFTLRTPGAAQAANFMAVVPRDDAALPPAIDLEFPGNADTRPTVADFQEELTIFIRLIKARYDREPVIYTTTEFRRHYLVDYPLPRLWLRAIITAPRLPGHYRWRFWQYSDRGQADGIDGFVDRNVFNGSAGDFADFLKQKYEAVPASDSAPVSG